MRKVSILSIVGISVVLLSYGLVLALTGKCVNCHTMHNSQNGAPVASGGPYNQLLVADCIPCHTGPVASERINSFGAPIVLGTTDPGGQGGTYTLAGGDFWWVATTGGATDSKGHNVETIANVDTALSYTPPGWDPNATPGALNDGQINNGAGTWTNQLRCAGLYGCHGNHNDADQMAAIKGAHHGNTGLTTTQADGATTVGGSYRFLGGINGLEHEKWNYNETASSHNEYYGVDGNASYENKRTISYSCAQCHGEFHSDLGSPSPWLRHPTDIMLPGEREYQYYNPDGLPLGSGAAEDSTDYSIEAPVARPTVPSSSSKDVTPGTDAIVMCLSCHRAHGSNYADILRWNYDEMRTGSYTSTDSGCFTCHTQKNAD